MRRTALCLVIACPLILSLAAREQTAVEVSPAKRFDRSRCGQLSGVVRWEGDQLTAAPFAVRTHDHFARRHLLGKSFVNPHVPIVDETTRGVAGAVVWLAGVDPAAAAPWPHAPVRVEQRDYRFIVHQGESKRPSGFVRKGDTVEFVSRQRRLQIIRARGAALLSLPFIDRDKPATRTLSQNGIVELTSGIGHYWMRGYLFVSEHPYYTHTDSKGRFHFDNVPAGTYAAICWMPNPNVVKYERDTESGYINQAIFAKAMEQERDCTIEAGKETQVNFTVYQQLFQP